MSFLSHCTPPKSFLSTADLLCLPLHRLSVLRDAGDGVRSDLRRSDQRLVVRRPGLGGRKRPLVDREIGLDGAAGQTALQKRVVSGGYDG